MITRKDVEELASISDESLEHLPRWIGILRDIARKSARRVRKIEPVKFRLYFLVSERTWLPS